MFIYTSLYPCNTHMDTIGAYIKHTHRASTVALSSTVIRTCEILSSQRIKASSKRLLYIAVPRYSHLRRGFRMDTHDKYTEIIQQSEISFPEFSYPIKILYYSILRTTKEYKIIHRRTVNQSQAMKIVRLRLIFHSPESNFARSRNGFQPGNHAFCFTN